jgi:hypothetical protein
MPVSDQDLIKQRVEAWRRAGPALERVRRAELRALPGDHGGAMIDALFEIGCRFAVPRPSSGLIEQQRLFRKLKP